MRRTLSLLLAVAVAVVLPAVGASASATPPPADSTLEYEGSHQQTLTDPTDGETDTGEVQSHTTRVFCDADGCTAFVPTGEIPLVDGTGTLSTPERGSVCGDDWDGAETTTVTATATTLTWVIETAGSAVADCGGGSTQWIWASHWEFEGALVAGEPCFLDATCPVAADPGAATTPVADPDARDLADRTVLSGVPTVGQAATPGNVLWAVVGAVILALLVALPTYFFNSAAETASERIGAWWARIRPRRAPAAAARPARLPGWAPAALGVLAAAVISAFADPTFALDAAGARVFLSIAVALGIEVCLGWVAVILLVRRTHPDATATYRFAPLSLLVVAAAVLLTRLSGFEPPVVFGLVAGVAFAGLVGAAATARVTLLGLGWAFGIGVLAWCGYSVLVVTRGPVVVTELLSAAAIAGMSSLPIALLPVRGLAGRAVWEWSKPAWGLAYGIGMLAFLLVLLPLPASWETVGIGLWTWIGLYLLYALVAVGIWLAVTRPWRRAEDAAGAAGSSTDDPGDRLDVREVVPEVE